MKRLLIAWTTALVLVASSGAALAQSACQYIAFGAVLTAAQWNQCFSAKQNTLGYVPVNKAGDVMLGKLVTATPTPTSAGLNLPQGSAPTSPANGDMWTTIAGVFVRINGATVGPLAGAGGIALNSGNIFVGNAFNVAVGVATSGDVTNTNTGVFTVRSYNGGTVFGTAAAVNTGTSGATIPLNNVANLFSAAQIISTNSGTLPASITGAVLTVGGANGNTARIQIDSFGGIGAVTVAVYGGTSAAPTQITSGTQLNGLNAYAYTGSALVGPIVSFRTYAAENIAAGAWGSKACIGTTPTGTATLTDSLCQQASGGVTVGSPTGGDKGAGTLNATGLYVNGTAVGAAAITSLTGDVTASGPGVAATTIAANVVTYAKFQQVAASSLVGNATGSLANATGITIGATLAFSGSALQTAAGTGDVSWSANSFATTIGATKVTSAMLNADVFSTAHSWGGVQTLTTPVFTGLPTGTGVATGNTASTLVARDSSGNFSANNITGNTFTGNAATATTATTATNATNSAITDDTTTNASMNLAWVTAATGNLPLKVSSTKLNWNPSTATLSAATFAGALSGNATTATTLATGRTIFGSAAFDGSAAITSAVGVAFGGTGLATLTANNVILGNGTSTPLFVAPGTSGNVLTSNGTTWASAAPAASITGTTLALTNSSATGFADGQNGATNPAFVVDSSTASQVAGLKVTGAATGGTVALAAIDSGSNTNLTINAKGSGTIGIGSVSTGAVTITPATTFVGIVTTAVGSAAAPSLAIGNSTTGLYSVSTTGFGVSVNGVLKWDYGITTASQTTVVGALAFTGILMPGSGSSIQWNGRAHIYSESTSGISFFNFNENNGFYLTVPAANYTTLQFGPPDAASPGAQTLKVQDVVAGTSNVAGGNFTIQAAAGTGTGAGGSFVFQVAAAGGSGTSKNAQATALTIDSTKLATFAGQLNVTAMTQTSAAQSGTMCYNSGTGAITYDATVGCLASTMRVKKNWHDIDDDDAMTLVAMMRPGSFSYIEGLGLPAGEQIGLAAEQIEKIDGRLVAYDDAGRLRGVRYQQASALYPAAIRALKAANDNLRTANDDLTLRVKRLEGQRR